MNTKTVAMALVALMAVSCMTAAFAAESDGETIEGDPVGLNFTTDGQAEVTLLVNDYAFIGGEYTIAWSAAPLNGSSGNEYIGWGEDTVSGNADNFPTEEGSTLTGIDDLTLTISRESSSGVYKLTMSSDKPDTYNFAVRAEITVTVNSTKLSLDPVYFKFSATVTEQSGLELRGFEAMTFDYGVKDSQTLTFTQSGTGYAPDVTSLTWYAIGLPTGLAMTANGTVTGMPLEYDGWTGGKNVDIYARNESGQTYYGELKVTIKAPEESGTSDFTYDVNATSAGTNTYVTQQNKDVELTVKSSTLPTVWGIDDNGRHTLSPSSSSTSQFEYKIPTSGTGAYTVEITVDNVTKTFVLYVFATPSAVQAEIHVSTVTGP